MHVGLFAGEPFSALHFPAPMNMIIERRGTDVGAGRFLFQNPMDLTHGDRGIGQMFQHFGHHHDVETLVAKVYGRGEIHLVAGDTGLMRGLERELVDVHADPADEIHEADQHAALASNIYAEALLAVPESGEFFSIKARLGFLVLMAPGVITFRPTLAVLFVEFANQARPAIRLV